ncbi:hypothetical protein [Bacillus sp. FSL K6-3149]|uniref:hypothetical protein n=1 Tax=Bacillus TaxID=1386 RepID=UPI00315A8F8B
MAPFSEAKETFNIEGQKDFQVMSFENLGSQDNIERDENDNDEIVEDLTEEEIINEMAEQLKFLYTKAATVNKQGEIIKVDIDKVEAEYGSPEPNNQEAMIASDFLTSDHKKTLNLNNIQILNFHHWIKKDHGISELEIDDYIEKIENDALTPVK